MKKIFQYLKPYIKEFCISQILMIVATVSALLFPWFIGNFFDKLFISKDIKKLVFLIGIVATLFIISHLTNYIKDIMLGIIGEKIIMDLRLNLYEKLQRLSIGFYSKQKSGDIVSRLTNDINLFQMSLSTGLTFLLNQLISLLVVTYMLFKLDIILTLIVFSMFPLIFLVSKKMGSRAKTVSKKVQQKLGDITSFSNESISGMNIIKTFVLEKIAFRMYRKENEELLNHAIENVKIKATSNLCVGFLTSTQLVLLIGVGGLRVFNGNITAGDLIAFLLYVEMIVGPISMLSNLYIDVVKSIAAINRIFEILNSEDEIKDKEHAITLNKIKGEVQLKDISFGYEENQKVLEHTTIKIKSGEKIALVGKSGAGKSTIINLIPRFYEVDNGEILIDGYSIKDVKIKSLRKQIGIVPQDTNLFGMSIKDNILCGNPHASDAQVIDAAKKANAHEFIIDMKYKYDTHIGERGATLSGGQRQRLAIARAFLKNPKILLLDEATSALDTESERKVQEALFELMKDRTTITIAHRLSTIVNSDRIYVMNDGAIIADGTHEELLEKCSYYTELYTTQYQKAL